MELYKYMPAEKFEEYIINGPTIRFTPPKEFNDPFEFKPAIVGFENERKLEEVSYETINEEAVKRYDEVKHLMNFDKFYTLLQLNMSNLIKFSKDLILGIANGDNFLEQVFKKIGVFCATANNANILMWSHYADRHYGVTISFDGENTFFQKIPNESVSFKAVNYKLERPNSCIENMVNPDLWYTKSKLWEYEQEYRIISALTPKAKYDWVNMEKGVCRIPKYVIKSVTFGCKCSNKQIDNWYRQLLAKGGFEHLKFYKAEMDKLEYKLNIVPLV